MTEFAVVMEPSPGYTARLAAELEAMGFDALLCPDTQCLSPDPYGQLALAAARTTRLRLGTGVTNPFTRDSSVTAGAFSTRSITARVNSSTSCGFRLVTILPSTTAGSSTMVAPAFLRSVRIDGQLVARRPRRRSVSSTRSCPTPRR